MIEKKLVEKVAHLARLSLSEQELESFAQKLSSVMDNFNQINRIDTTGVEPMVTPVEMTQNFREDQVADGIGSEAALAAAPERTGNLFKVPPVV